MDTMNEPIGICRKCGKPFKATTHGIECGCTTSKKISREDVAVILDAFDNEMAAHTESIIEPNQELMEKAAELVKDVADIQTPIITADGEIIILYSAEPFTDEEKAELQSLTKRELTLLMKINNFKAYKP